MVTQSYPATPGEIPWRRIGVTLAVLVVYRLGLLIPVPGIDQTALAAFMRTSWSGIERVSLFTLGVVPLLSIYTLAETLRLLSSTFARWQGNPVNDRRLRRWLRNIALGLAAVQAYAITTVLEDIGGIVAAPGWPFRIGVIGSLVAATALLSWLADAVSRHGLGNGFWLLAATPVVAGLAQTVPGTLELIGQGIISSEAVLANAAYIVLGTALLVALSAARPPDVPDALWIGVWPPILAYMAMGWVAGLLSLGATAPATWPWPARLAYLAGIAVLIWLFAWRTAVTAEDTTPVSRDPGETADDERLAFLARRRVRLRLARLAALAQIAICAAGEILAPLSPLVIPGMWLIVTVTVALGVLRALRIPETF